ADTITAPVTNRPPLFVIPPSTGCHIYCKPFSSFLLTFCQNELYSKCAVTVNQYFVTVYDLSTDFREIWKGVPLVRIKGMLFAAMMAAITAVMGLFPGIPLPGGVPIVLQNMGVMLAGCLLGKRNGGLAILLFVLLAA